MVCDFGPYEVFAANSTRLEGRTLEGLHRAVEIMRTSPDIRIRIGGHADSAEQDPEAIALARAQTVLAFLLDAGIARERIHRIEGFGDSRMIVIVPNCRYPDGSDLRQSNRRYEMYIED